MSVFIEGKPLNEWIEEQKKKDGVLLVHRGTIRNGYSKSVYTGAIVTNAGKDVCYEDADITVRIKGTEYRLTGSRVERHDGRCFVNGKERTDIPVQSVKESRKANDDLQEDISEQLNKVFSD